jgi:quinone-modifying oxidoreductase subunit QmoC
VVCPISPPDNPFPRKEMLMAQWGMKEDLASNLDIWLCHNCNDCSRYCPRDARPGDVMAAVRNYFMTDFALPQFLRRPFFSLAYFLFVIALVVFLRVSPLASFQSALFIVAGLALVVTLIGLTRFWKKLNLFEKRQGEARRGSGGNAALRAAVKMGFLTSLDSSQTEILRHTNFSKCTANKGNYVAHMLIFYGIGALFATCVAAQIYSLTGVGLPLPLTNPFKILGMIGGLAVLGGLTLIIYRRVCRKDEAGKGTYYDWFFIVSLYLLTITGLVLPILRLVDATDWVHSAYLLHLMVLFLSIACFPFSKFVHPLYRAVAMAYAKRIGRELGGQMPTRSGPR